MEGYASANDISAVVAADKAHVWHHLSQHKGYEQPEVDPRIIVEGKGLRVWDARGKEYIDAVSVSYTHLDVYKRQGWRCVGASVRNPRCRCCF